ncbi:MAG: diguanylate cyclase, partial [Clostridiales bacterium]|nr:diguanylate cyclase [Clostridiales bacterium]
KEVLFLSYHDQLTGLYNRRFYEEELKRLDIEKNLPITFIMSDVNGLKLTNDAFGHLTGDKLLKAYADILRQECRSEDIIARIGGDEFVVLLPRTDSSRGEIIVNRIISAISKKKLEKALLSVSFGWRTKEDPNEPFDEIYKQAEDFMYRRKLTESTSIKSDILKLITKSLYDKNHVEQQHGEHVSTLCRSIGLALELNPSDLNDLTLAGLLHDVGKIGMSENLLNKPTELNESEMAEIRRHPEIGYQILRAVNEFADIAEYVLAHHERIDGKGYPKGLKGKDIPLVSKIIGIADAYDAMTGNYSTKVCMSSREAAAVLKTESGKQFDSHIVKVFIQKVLGEEW